MADIPIRIIERDDCFRWHMVVTDYEVWGDIDSTLFGTRELAIEHAKRFWGQYGAEIEVKDA